MDLECTNCCCCGANQPKFLYKVPDLRLRVFDVEYSVQRCGVCGHDYLSPRPAPSMFKEVYPQSYYMGREKESRRHALRYRKQLEYLPQKPGTLLDVGCAGGAFLEVARQAGWICYGCDFQLPLNLPRDIHFQEGLLPDIAYQDSFFDVVTAWGVFEHLYDPKRYFQTLCRILKPNGLCLLLVSNGASLWSRWAYKEDIPRHVQFYNPTSMERFLRESGLISKKMLFPMNYYTTPATGRGLFRRHAMRLTGANWQEVLGVTPKLVSRISGKIGSIFDLLFIHPWLEEIFNLSGNLLVIGMKPNI